MLHADLQFDVTSGFVRDRKFQSKYQLNNYNLNVIEFDGCTKYAPFERIRRGVLKGINRYVLPASTQNYIEDKSITSCSDITGNLRKSITFDGYWQDPRFFSTHERDLKKKLIPKTYISNSANIFLNKFKGRYLIGVHLRIFDNHDESIYLFNYYVNNIKNCVRANPNSIILIFSNNHLKAVDFLNKSGLIGEIVSIDNHSQKDLIEFEIMRNCDALILANSTFSWWAGWSNYRPNATIICPEISKGIGSNLFNSKLIPNSWISYHLGV